MAILLRNETTTEQRDVLVFGSGGIGTAIVHHLHRRAPFSSLPFVVPWSTPTDRVAALHEIAGSLEFDKRAQGRPLSVVWAAGTAGFSATRAETEHELAAYRDVLDLVERIPRPRESVPHSFHLISSAGGLYEGRTVRSPSEHPTPARYYGRLKLTQENDALARLRGLAVQVYRPSSVYAAPGQARRPGLIGTLVRDGITRQPTTIFGAFDTLRDYVAAADVGSYVADRSLESVAPHGLVHMLVSAQPVSIRQVIATVESVIRQPLYIHMADSWNARNIVFMPPVKATDFSATPLRVGIKRLYTATVGRPIIR